MTSGIDDKIKDLKIMAKNNGYALLKVYFTNKKENKKRAIIKDGRGYKYDVSIAKIKNTKDGVGLSFVHSGNPFSLYNIDIWLNNNRKNIKITSKSKYVATHEKIDFYCVNCKSNFKISWNCIYHKEQGCQRCSPVSKGEVHILNWLDENKIEYVPQKYFSDCRILLPLRFDFYLPNYNLCIEYDGELHYRKYRIDNNADIKLKHVKKSDRIKTKYCKDNNIGLLRIPYWEFKNIETILNKEII